MKKMVLIAIIVAVMPAVLPASGGEPLAFLKYAAGVRATGMGGAYTAVADDLSAVYYNPAGLVKLDDLQFMAETYMLSFGRSISYISTGKPFTIGRSLYTTAASWLNYSAGEDIEERVTNSFEPKGTISAGSNIFAFSVATILGETFYIGGNFKFIFHNIGEAKGSGVGFDIGAMADLTRELTAGVSVSNISTNLSWSNSAFTETIPVTFMSGISYDFAKAFGIRDFRLLGSAGLNTISDYEQLSFKTGAEAGFNDFVFLRAGYGRAFSAGAGIKLKPSEIFAISFDYAFEADTILPGMYNNRVSIKLDYVFPHWSVKVEDVSGKEKKDQKTEKKEKGTGGAVQDAKEDKTEVEGFNW